MNYKIAAYIRLSKEDSKNKESESITNQRKLIKQYLNHHNLTITKEYIDDGFTGTTFNRPAFNNLIKDIENKKINMVITKDLSRLGRNYLKCGYYIEEYFPTNKIRYISILDNIDTKTNPNNDIAPFKALFNDMVSKDTSKKIKSILKSKKAQGLYLSSKAPYGYKKNKQNKHKLIINQKQAKIVKKIYTNYLNGNTINQIATILNKNNIPSPSNTNWSYISVYNTLKNPVYIGITTQNVWTNISYKNKTKIKRNKDQWIITQNAHKPIITKDIYNKVQTKLKTKHTKAKAKREPLPLEGLIYCAECNHTLGVNHNKKTNKWFLICNNYKKNSIQKTCTPHYTNYQKLENEIIKVISKHININILNQSNQKQINQEKNKLKLLYEDRLNKIITLDEYQKYKEKIEIKIKTIKTPKTPNIDRNLIHSLINKITINKAKQIKIYYNFKKPKN